jgi:CheY-like chemotaxis protein/DNA-binding XRE family transcriptional regulator
MTQMDVKKEFGAAVRAHRLRLGMSQEALAERAELHRTYVTDVERGARNLSLESISRLARALDVSIDSLFLTTARRGGIRPGVPTPSPKPEAIDILLVEDDPKDIELTLAAFKKANFANRVKVVRDGAAALDYLLVKVPRRGRRESSPQVVLLDLYLPKVNGLDVLRTLRSNESTQGLHVIVLTNSRNNANLREALRLGAKAYLVKPIGFHNFSAITPQLNFYWTLLTSSPHSAD